MKLTDVDLNLFLVFDAIYSEANLTRAGQIIGITQPAVSNALGRLRETFSDPLFVRTAQGMVPTPLAQSIVGPIREALALLGSTVSETDIFNPLESEKRFRINMDDLTESILLPLLSHRLQEVAPRISLESLSIKRRDLAKAITAGHVDFIMDGPLTIDGQIQRTKLVEDRYVCIVSKHHPLAKHALTLDEYLSLRHLHINPRGNSLGDIDSVLAQQGQRRHIAMTGQHYLMAAAVLKSSDLALTAPASFACKDPALHQMELPIQGTPPFELFLYWHENSTRDPAHCWMKECLINLAEHFIKTMGTTK